MQTFELAIVAVATMGGLAIVAIGILKLVEYSAQVKNSSSRFKIFRSFGTFVRMSLGAIGILIGVMYIGGGLYTIGFEEGSLENYAKSAACVLLMGPIFIGLGTRWIRAKRINIAKEALLIKFKTHAVAFLNSLPQDSFLWTDAGLMVLKRGERGFDVHFKVNEDAICPVATAGAYKEFAATDWRYADPVDEEKFFSDLCKFAQTLTTDEAELEIWLAGNSPYKWILRSVTKDGPYFESTTRIFFNYFAKRRKEIFKNSYSGR